MTKSNNEWVPEVGQECEWVRCIDELPNQGEKVIIYSNSVVQEETYTLDQDDSDFACGYFWNRDDLDECPAVDFQNDAWMYLPKPPFYVR